MHQVLRRLGSLALFALCACGPAPVPVESGQSVSTGGTELPPDHPPLEAASPEPVSFVGSVRLLGELATREDGYVFITIKPEGIMMPSYSHKYALSEAGALEDGERRLAFHVDEKDSMGGLAPTGPHVIEAWFDVDGFVDSKGDGYVVSTPVGRGGEGIELTLDPATAARK